MLRIEPAVTAMRNGMMARKPTLNKLTTRLPSTSPLRLMGNENSLGIENGSTNWVLEAGVSSHIKMMNDMMIVTTSDAGHGARLR